MPTTALAQHPITVLLVDDQPIIGASVQRMIEGHSDIHFHYCADPLQALELAGDIAPTAILLDLVMPQISGLTLLRYFRAHPATREIPVIVLSSKEEGATKADAFTQGASDYIVKLPDAQELLARIRYHSKGYISLLQRNEAYRALQDSRQQLETRNRFIREMFGRYVPDEVVEQVLETPGGVNIGGELRVVTILMSDLRGFTSTCTRLKPESVVQMLNLYLETMTEIILRHGGTINEFIGDSIVVVFGAPISHADDPRRAVACALEMQKAMEQINSRNQAAGHPEIRMGIGINTGEVVAGNIGSRRRAKYDVIGHNVNLASRIESYSLGGQVLVSESTLEACGAGEELRIDGHLRISPKGVKQALSVYEIGGIGGEHQIFLPLKEPPKLVYLAEALAVDFSILDGKQSGGEAYPAKLLRAGEQAAELQASRNCRQLTNLQISMYQRDGKLISREIYAKVTEVRSELPPVFRVHFTFIPPEAENFLQAQIR
jgi:adenylate cyclase